MGERKDRRVKRLAPQLGGDTTELRVPNRLSIERISENRMPVLGEMHPNLMGAPCLEMATN
jgi:hypothetical protein